MDPFILRFLNLRLKKDKLSFKNLPLQVHMDNAKPHSAEIIVFVSVTLTERSADCSSKSL